MEKLVKHTGLAVPLNLTNVDTDQLMPKQFLKWVSREGYGKVLFFDWRYLEDGSDNPDFVLNHERYKGASILLAQENFGSGSSREHAPWGLTQYGFRAVIAPSFADIFANNSFNNGLLLIRQDQELVDEWMKRVEAAPGYTISIDLPGQTITGSDGYASSFEIDPFQKHRLLKGLDAIGLTLEHEAAIKKYEDAHKSPWTANVAG